MSSRNSDIAIYPYRPDVTPAILELLRITLGEAPNRRKTADFWHWKHQANTFGESYGLYAWSETQKVAVGLRVLMRWAFKTPGGQHVLAVRAVDTATHPNHQRLGIFATLTRQAVADLEQAGVHLIFNTPNQNSRPGYLKLGWQVVEKWPLFIKILRPIQMLSTLLRRRIAIPPATQFEQYFNQDIVPWAIFVSRYREVIPAVVSAWETNRCQVGLRTPRDLTYLQWRYGQHPHINYGVYALERGKELAGFAILRANLRYGCREIVLTEIFLREPSLNLGKLLLKNLYKQLKGDYMVAHFAQGTLERDMLRRTGFVQAPLQGIIFTVRPLNPLPQDTNALDPIAWDLALGDLEIF
jgi:GNAT superfamily N-acetyltransferase